MAQRLIACPIAYWAEFNCESSAVHWGSETINYRALNQRIAGVEQQLRAQGVQAGQHLAAIAANSLELISLLWACWRQRILCCPINPRLPKATIEAMLARIDARWLWSPEPLLWSIPSVDINFRQREVDVAADLDLDAYSNMIFTSGSSGHPKAVVHRFGHHWASAEGSASLIPVKRSSRWLLSLPLFHVGGLAILVRCFRAGATVSLPDERGLAEQLYDQPISHLSLVPTQLYRLLFEQGFTLARSQLEFLLLGGGALSQTLLEAALQRGIKPFVSYGLSEMSSQVCTRQLHRYEEDVGLALPGREFCIAQGEILVRGQTLFAGYYQQGEVDAQVDDAGWFHTQDRGEITVDDSLIVLGRMDRMLISGGENIQPGAIERELCRYPGVIQAVVIAIGHPQWGQRPVAFIQLNQGPLDEALLRRWLVGRIASFMIPDYFLPWPEDTGNGLKISRRQLESVALNHQRMNV